MVNESTDSDAPSKHAASRMHGTITATSEDELATARTRDTHEVKLDEPGWDWMPYGADKAPSPGDYLCIAVAGCQLEVVRQCFVKAGIDDFKLTMTWERHNTTSEVNTDPMPDHTSVRVQRIDLDLAVETTEEHRHIAERCLAVCEDACIISRSVENGITIPLSKQLNIIDNP